MIRRIFLRRLLHGLGLAAAAHTVADAPRPEVVSAVTVPSATEPAFFRLRGNLPPARVGWDEQAAGDRMLMVHRNGVVWSWTVARVTPEGWSVHESGSFREYPSLADAAVLTAAGRAEIAARL